MGGERDGVEGEVNTLTAAESIAIVAPEEREGGRWEGGRWEGGRWGGRVEDGREGDGREGDGEGG